MKIRSYTEEQARLYAIEQMTQDDIIAVKIEFDSENNCWWTLAEVKTYDW